MLIKQRKATNYRTYVLSALMIGLLLVSQLLTGCGPGDAGNTAGENTYRDISAETLNSMMEKDGQVKIIDVREQDEYSLGHIPGAVLLPMSEFQSRAGEIPQNTAIVLVCATGARSSLAAGYLVEKGFTQVYNLEGGMAAWSYDIAN